MALNFNIQGAKDAGFSNTQIKDYLRSQKSDVDFEALQSASDEYARNAFESAFAQNPNLLNDYANYLAKKGDSSNQTSADSANSNKIQNADSQSTQSTQLSDDELKARFLQDLSDEYFFDKAKDAKITPKPRDVSQYSDDLSGVFERGVGQTITNALGSIDNATLGIGKAISKDIAKRDDELNKALNEHIDYGTQFSDLPDVLKRKLAEQGGIFDYVLGLDYGLERQYEKEQLKRKIANDEITFADLSKEQKDLVSGHSTYERVQSVVGEALALAPFAKAGKLAKIAAGAVVGGKEAYNIYDSFKTDSDRQKELKDELLSQEVSYTFKRELEKINNFHASKDIFSITGASVEQKQDYLNAVSQVFGTLGIKEYGVDSKGQIYLSTPQGYAKVEMGFFESLMPLIDDNKFSIAGAIAGASKGAKAKGFKGMVAGGAVGAFAGGSLDYMLAMNSQEREVKASQMLRHATQEGLLSIVGDVAFATGAKLVKKVATTDIKELANNAVQASFIPGLAKNFLDGNKTAALKMRDTHLSASDVQTIETLSKSFGGEVQMPKSEVLKTIEESSLSPFLKKGAEIALEVFIQQNQKDTQAALLQAVRADKSGNLIAFLTQAANSSPLLNKNLQDLLSQTTNNLFQKIQALGFKNTDARDIIRSVMEVNKGVRDENGKLVKIGTYEDVMSNVLGKHFDENFKVQIDSSKFEKFKADLESSGVKLKDEPSLEMFEKNIYNAQGVTFNQLINIRKELNQHLSRSSNATYINRAKMAIQNFIKDDIDTGINNIFKLDSEFGDSAKALFDSTLADYAKLKDLLKQVKDSKILEANKEAQRALEKLIKNLSGQGNGKISNLEALTRNIPKENIADFEVSVLMGAMQKAMKSIETFGKDSAGNEIKIFDSSSFLNELKNIQGIQSKAAKDLIQIVEDWNTLFKNDFEIAQRLQRVVTDGLHTSIATTASGLVARNALVVKANMFFRILPHIPFLKSLNERVQGAAVRFHLSKALRESVSVSDFKLNLQAKINTSNEINTESKQLLAQLRGEISSVIEQELQNIEQKLARENITAQTAQNIDNFVKTDAFKELPKQKQDAFLTLKEVNPAKMPTPLSEKEFLEKDFSIDITNKENFITHTKNSDDPTRIDYIHLVEPTMQNPNLVLYGKNKKGEPTIEHIKVFDDGKDRFYVAITQDDGKTLMTGIPTTKFRDIRRRIIDAENIQHEIDRGFSSALSTHKGNAPKLENDSSTNLTPLQKAQLAKEQMIKDKLEAQRLADEQFSQRMQEAQKQMQENLESKAANAGLAINDSGIKIGEKIQIRTAGNAPSVSLSDDEIIPTKYAIVKASDLKPQFNSASGLQFRTQADEQTIQNIAQNFEPNKIIGRGGFDDLPIIISDGQVISGNHRAKAMQQFTQGKDLKEQINSFYDEFDDYKAVRSLGKAFENEPMKKAVVSNVVENAHKTLDDVPQALRQEIEQANNIKPLAEFGENFAEFYKNGKGAIAKLLKEKRGQVAGAFHRDDIGDITLAWGEAGSSKSDGWGLAKIEKYHPEVLDDLHNLVQNLPLVKETEGRYKLQDNDYFISIRKEFDGQKENWILTAFEKDESIARRRTNLPSAESATKKTTLDNAGNNSTTNLNASRDKYTQAIKERLGIELKDDELLVRIADIDETSEASKRTIINLAMASNANRAGKVGDVFVSALGKYDKNIQNLPRILGDEADNVEQLKYIVARELDKNAQYPNIEEANKALFASLAKSTSSKNMAEALNIAKDILKNDEAAFAKLSQMLTDNAGNFRNLVNNIADMGYKNLEVRPYLTDAIIHTAKNLDEGTRKVNIQNLVTNLEADIANANANGGIVQNLFGENKEAFNNYISEALGVALARFVRLENPSANLFEFFKSLEKDLYEKAQPDFFNMNKTPDDINIIDFITILLEKGQITESVQKLGASLETLREPYAQFLKSVNKNAQKASDEVAENAVVSKMANTENPTISKMQKVENQAEVKAGDYKAQEITKKTQEKTLDDFMQSPKFNDLRQDQKEALQTLKNIIPAQQPPKISEQEFLQKYGDRAQNIIEHIKDPKHTPADQAKRLSALNLVEPTLKDWDFKLYQGAKTQTFIKAFKGDGDNVHYLIATKENQNIFITALPITGMLDLINRFKGANNIEISPTIIHSLNREVRKAQDLAKDLPNGLTDTNSSIKELKQSKPTFKETFEQAQTQEQKVDAIKKRLDEVINEQMQDLQKAKSDLENISFSETEMQQAIKEAERTYEKLIGKMLDEQAIKRLAQAELEKPFKDLIETISEVLNKNISARERLVHNFKHAPNYAGNAQRLEKDIASLSKRLIKEESEDIKIKGDLTYKLDEAGMQRARKQFYANEVSKEQAEIFEKALPIAQELGVRVRNALNHYNKKDGNVVGVYTYDENMVRVKHHFLTKDKSEIFLHELIHSVSSRAITLLEKGETSLLTRNQIQAIENITQIYKQTISNPQKLGFKGDEYGLTNSHEFLAEIFSNPDFMQKAKQVNVFKQVIDAIVRFFVGDSRMGDDMYKAVQKEFYDLIENYTPNFTKNYERAVKYNRILYADEQGGKIAENLQGAAVKFTQEQKELIRSYRVQTSDKLKKLINQKIVKKLDEVEIDAQVSNTTISEITSERAVSKSVENGFSIDEHFEAAQNIKELFEQSKFILRRDDIKNNDPAIKIWEFKADFKDGKARILVKESLDKDARRIYDLKLESLEKAGLEPPTPSGEASKQSQSHKNTSGESNAPFEINSNPSTNNAKISNKQKVKNRILEKKINKLEATKQRLQSAQAIQKLNEIINKHKNNLISQGVRLGIKQDLASGED